MTTLDDPCQGILLEQPTQIELSRKLQMLNEVLQEHGITAVGLLYVMRRKIYLRTCHSTFVQKFNEKLFSQQVAPLIYTLKHVRGTTPSLASRLAMTQGQSRPNC